jgi:hypothetical protein
MVPKIMLLAALLCLFGLRAPFAGAQSDLDRCNDILKPEMFNRVSSSTQSSASEKAAQQEYIFSMSDTEAYAEYESEYKSIKKQDTSVSGDFHYGFIGGSASVANSYDRELSQDEFSKKFEAKKQEYQHNSISSSSKDASMISVFQSSIRDEASVKAWEHCMTTKSSEPGLFAYGYRDPGGNPYIVVIWSPGAFAASTPVIDVTFEVTDPGMTVQGVQGTTQIASGSGAAFPVHFTNSDDRKAMSDGFAVLVNGKLKSGDKLIQSFRSEATVPRNLGALPCSSVFGANRTYEFGMIDPEKPEGGPTHWGWMTFTTLAQAPGDQAGTVVYRAILAAGEEISALTSRSGTSLEPTQVLLRVTGTNFQVFETVHPVGHPGDSPAFLGDCTGQLVRAHWGPTNRFGAAAPDIAIRPR